MKHYNFFNQTTTRSRQRPRAQSGWLLCVKFTQRPSPVTPLAMRPEDCIASPPIPFAPKSNQNFPIRNLCVSTAACAPIARVLHAPDMYANWCVTKSIYIQSRLMHTDSGRQMRRCRVTISTVWTKPLAGGRVDAQWASVNHANRTAPRTATTTVTDMVTSATISHQSLTGRSSSSSSRSINNTPYDSILTPIVESTHPNTTMSPPPRQQRSCCPNSQRHCHHRRRRRRAPLLPLTSCRTSSGSISSCNNSNSTTRSRQRRRQRLGNMLLLLMFSVGVCVCTGGEQQQQHRHRQALSGPSAQRLAGGGGGARGAGGGGGSSPNEKVRSLYYSGSHREGVSEW